MPHLLIYKPIEVFLPQNEALYVHLAGCPIKENNQIEDLSFTGH